MLKYLYINYHHNDTSLGHFMVIILFGFAKKTECWSNEYIFIKLQYQQNS